ncbi:chromate transporter [Terrihabitans soli]|uniref:Chromate transporter n=1 Tax=Terrihabitans soli TaxID=708113 RepID=A0A6S6QVX3_9HYPH|nr:chromate transporter [Terrihabitans soli]BCJ91180.1 chromate transporter [Terrihabitans soli]
MQQPSPESPAPNPGLGALFLAFFGISIMGFGGVLPWARWMVVEKRGWLTPKEFNEALSLCQFLPGGNIVNFGVVIGSKYRGALGSIAAVSGMLIGPFFVVIGLASLYVEFKEIPGIGGMLTGVSAAASGLVVALTVKMALAMREEIVPLLFAVAGFVAVGVFRMPLIASVLVMAPITILYAWRRVQ